MVYIKLTGIITMQLLTANLEHFHPPTHADTIYLVWMFDVAMFCGALMYSIWWGGSI